MDVNELKKVKNFYETVICQGIIKPLEMNEIYSLVFPQEKEVNLIPMMLKQRRITAFVQNKYSEVLTMLEDAFKVIDQPQTGSAPVYDKQQQSHSEDESDNHKLLAKYEYELEKELDANARRSLKQKIYHIKKRIANETV